MKKYLPLLILTPVVFLLDQVTKLWVVANVSFQNRIGVIPGYFEIIHTKNRGAAFGMLASWDNPMREWFFYGVSAVALVALLVLYRQSAPDQRKVQVPLALILGGALGNLADRLMHGEVTDFLLLHWKNQVADFDLFGRSFHFVLSWPAFNIADAAISCGALYLVFAVAFAKKPTV